jgi:hypothetical protein
MKDNMQHLQVQANTNPKSDVHAPQEVIDALLTLTTVGLLTWNEGITQPKFSLCENDLTLDHVHDATDVDELGYGDGFLMHVTQEQVDAIKKAIEQERISSEAAALAWAATSAKK